MLTTFFNQLDVRLILAIYGALMSSYVFYRSHFRRISFSFQEKTDSIAQRLSVRVSLQEGPETFVEKLIFLGSHGAKVGEVDVFEFLRKGEVKKLTFTSEQIGKFDFTRISAVAHGRVYVVQRSN